MVAKRRFGRTFGRAMRRLPRDAGGLAAMEFALAAPVLFVALVGVVEMAMALFAGALLESALAEASRYGVTGFAAEAVSREQRVLDIVSERTLGLIDMDRIEIASLIYPSFEDIGRPEPFDDLNANGARDGSEPFDDINANGQWDLDMGTAGLGGPGDIVVYSIVYPWQTMTPLFEPVVAGIELSSSLAVRNEPF